MPVQFTYPDSANVGFDRDGVDPIRNYGDGITVTWSVTGVSQRQEEFVLDMHSNGRVFHLVNTATNRNLVTGGDAPAKSSRSFTIPWSWLRSQILLNFGSVSGTRVDNLDNIDWSVMLYNFQIFVYYTDFVVNPSVRVPRSTSDHSLLVRYRAPDLIFSGGSGRVSDLVSRRVSWEVSNYTQTRATIRAVPASNPSSPTKPVSYTHLTLPTICSV